MWLLLLLYHVHKKMHSLSVVVVLLAIFNSLSKRTHYPQHNYTQKKKHCTNVLFVFKLLLFLKECTIVSLAHLSADDVVTKIWIDVLERRMIKIRMMIDDGFTLNDFLWGGGVRRL